ncbi:MAG TPA: hypothetical protein ENH13_03935 [Euryarchaeota archaeon]|nr:hypothetical protein BMS3Abin16_01624 [archaeon BMS3Abin16]GBE56413.1 hypothetical protein BMS3Bbin16_00617 [archaeon BMS3Bbin16]HDH28263.1 hypothetical protein [Euryarchaeota archaeon]HDY74086.1 hypothetical protein [Euryarchaeota archaeon]
MEAIEPIHQRIDLASKFVGVIFVAIGIDRLRAGDISVAVSSLFFGALISVFPFFVGVKK